MTRTAPAIQRIAASAPLAARLTLLNEIPNSTAPSGRLKPMANIASMSVAQKTFPCRIAAPITMKMPGLHGRELAATIPPRIRPANTAPDFPSLL